MIERSGNLCSCQKAATYGLIGHSSSGSRVDEVSELSNTDVKLHAVCMSCIDRFYPLKEKKCPECPQLENVYTFFSQNSKGMNRKILMSEIVFRKNSLEKAIDENNFEKVAVHLGRFLKAGGLLPWKMIETSLENPDLSKGISKELLNAFLANLSLRDLNLSRSIFILNHYVFDLPEDADLLRSFCNASELSREWISQVVASRIQRADTIISLLNHWTVEVAEKKRPSLQDFQYLKNLLEKSEKINSVFLMSALSNHLYPDLVDFLIQKLVEKQGVDQVFWTILKRSKGALEGINHLIGTFEKKGKALPFHLISEALATGIDSNIKRCLISVFLKSPREISQSFLYQALMAGCDLQTVMCLLPWFKESIHYLAAMCVRLPNRLDLLKEFQHVNDLIRPALLKDALFFNLKDEDLIKYLVLEGLKSPGYFFEIQTSIASKLHYFSLQTFQEFIQVLFPYAPLEMLQDIFIALMEYDLTGHMEFFISYFIEMGRGEDLSLILESLLWGGKDMSRWVFFYQKKGGEISPSLFVKSFEEGIFLNETAESQIAFIDSFTKKGGEIPLSLLHLGFYHRYPNATLEKMADDFISSGAEIPESLIRKAIDRRSVTLVKKLISRSFEIDKSFSLEISPKKLPPELQEVLEEFDKNPRKTS